MLGVPLLLVKDTPQLWIISPYLSLDSLFSIRLAYNPKLLSKLFNPSISLINLYNATL